MSSSLERMLLATGLLVVLAGATPATAAVNKCVDAQGNVSFTDRPCGKDEKKQEIETQAPVRQSADAPRDPSTHFKQQMQDFNDAFAVKLRDLKARCNNGDKEACKDAICARLHTEGPSPSVYRECSMAEGYASTNVWAQTSKVSFDGSMSTSVSVVCLVNPEKLTLGGNTVTIYHHLRLAKSNHANAFHERERWSASVYQEGPDFATWEEAADGICKSTKAKG